MHLPSPKKILKCHFIMIADMRGVKVKKKTSKKINYLRY